MLVLSRFPSEAIYLRQPDGTVAAVQVLRVEGKKVVLGVAAPADVEISRDRPAAGPAPEEVPGGYCDDRR